MIVGKASEEMAIFRRNGEVGYTVLSKFQQLQVGSNVASF